MLPSYSPANLPDFLLNPQEYLARHWEEEMEVITGAPIAFSITVLLVGIVTWSIFRFLHKRQLDQIPILNARLAAQQEDIARRDGEIARLTRLLKEASEQQKSPLPAFHELPTWPLLTEEQRHTLHHLLATSDVFPHQERRVEIRSRSSPDDCAILAKDLSEIFRVSGWDTGPSPSIELSPDTPEGIRVYHTPHYRYADAVTQALLHGLGHAYGIIPQQETNRKTTEMPLLIVIGRNPR